jgi:nitrite reductase/ring-hydroxylating ferredoxin subunit
LTGIAQEGAAGEWTRVASPGDVIEGEPFASEADGVAIALYRLGDEIFAIGDICTHEHVRLSDGWLDGDRIECPLHQSCFEIRTGKVLNDPAYVDVACFAVMVEGDDIYVRAAE